MHLGTKSKYPTIRRCLINHISVIIRCLSVWLQSIFVSLGPSLSIYRHCPRHLISAFSPRFIAARRFHGWRVPGRVFGQRRLSRRRRSNARHQGHGLRHKHDWERGECRVTDHGRTLSLIWLRSDGLTDRDRECQRRKEKARMDGLLGVKIPTAVTGWDKFLHWLRIFGLLRWDTTPL